MSRILTSRRLFILLASVIVLIILAGVTLQSSGTAVWPESVVMDVENTVGSWVYRPISQLTGFFGGLRDLHQMYVQNAELKTEMQNYGQLRNQLAAQQEENARLAQMVGFKSGKGSQFQLQPAHIVGRTPSSWTSVVTIDVGTADGVQTNMPVVSTDGSLVGRVQMTAAHSAKVLLLTDTQVGDSVSAKVQVSGADQPFGVVSGSTSVGGDLVMNFLSPLANVSPGNVVVTSGLSSSLFPAGIEIGTVVKVQQGVQGLTQSAVIKPSANFPYLEDVFVVEGKAGKAGAK
ncbi:rod shape-determining protein MreC [Alicyclobacillus sp. ALC3]|uniref:rod shape-determining protein MreC n=1 Tax=Alicyclobacillus sp. ALC3 TaxID=2796143 RepID=UPI002378D4C0|nr:rod shape-determining protein MreC [Alicyclobacillus sp. ALC3]WDL96992.1 rod shape-determining protein MreC [Alicyclobacillus sp. ALC3]